MSDWEVTPAPKGESDWAVASPEAVPVAPAPETNFGRRMLAHVKSGANAVGTLATDALDAATGNYYSKVRNAGADLLSMAGHKIAPSHIAEGAGQAAAANEQAFNTEHPILEGTARGIGYMAPTSEASMLARSGEAVTAGLASRASPLVGRVLTSKPVSGAISGAVSGGGTAGAEAVQEGATPSEALQEAGQAAKFGGVLGAGVGAIHAGVAKAGEASPLRDKAIDAARKRSTRDIGQDIVSAEGPKARATAAQQVAEVNDRIFKMTQEDPSLRKVWSGSAEESLPKIQKIKAAIAEPLDRLYKDMDERTGGGIRLGDVVDSFKRQATEAGKMAKGIPDAERLNHVADLMLQAYGEEKPVYHAEQPVKEGDLAGMKTGDAIAMLEKKSRDPSATQEVARLREEATTKAVDLDRRIPTAQFREEVTHLGTTAQKAMGSIEGSVKHEALDKLYRAGKEIIDAHIDGSGTAPENIEQLRDINNKYFLLSRAEAAIESRGTKEANRTKWGLARNPHQALAMGAVGTIPFAAMNPEQIPHMVAAHAVAHAIPEVAKAANWKVANLPKTGSVGDAVARSGVKPPTPIETPNDGTGYRASVRRLAAAAWKAPDQAAFVSAATRAGLSPSDAHRIYLAAHPEQTGEALASGAP